jgi:uncharacterized membrane protein
MKKTNYITGILGIIAAAVGVALVLFSRGAAIAQEASAGQKLLFALSLLLTLGGVIAAIVGFLPKRKPANVRTLVTAAMFAALCYIGFAFLRIDIPVGTEKTAFHLGNVFCVLAALFLGGFWGGMSGAIGLTIADLTSGYVTSAPKTFLLKLGIGLLAGLVAHKVFHLNKPNQSKLPLPVITALSCTAGMAFNVVADPLVGYFYKMYVLGVPQDAAAIWVKMGAVTTLVNAIIAVVVATILYLALRPALKRSNLLNLQ